ncbi:MAG: response regulator [Bacteroidales bacterium]|nr:response regulator [Bacteroidales bacterium]
MKNYWKYLLTLLLVLTTSTQMPAAEVRPYTQHIDMSNGLVNDFVRAMHISGQGYTWVITEGGVSVIAGPGCRTFRPLPYSQTGNATSLMWHNQTKSMLIGAEHGLMIYRPTSDRTYWFGVEDGLPASSINAIEPAGQDAWMGYGDGSVLRVQVTVDEEDVPHITYQKLVTSITSRIRCLMDDGRGQLYIGYSQEGMSIVSIMSGATTTYLHRKGIESSLPGNNVRRIITDREGRIWVGTDRGLAQFDAQAGTFTKVHHRNAEYEDNIYDICHMNNGAILVASDIGGIKELMPDVSPLYYTDTKVQVSSRHTRCITMDDYGNAWVGNYSTGVDVIGFKASDFVKTDYEQPVTAMEYDSVRDVILVTDQRELSEWRKDERIATYNKLQQMQREYVSCRCMMVDRDGYVWVGIDDEGAFRLNRSTDLLEHIDLQVEGADVHCFAQDQEGTIWIGAEPGIYTYRDGKATQHDDISRMMRSPATTILPMGDRLFVCTYGDGIFSIDLQTMSYRHLDMSTGLPTNRINQAVSDGGQGMWLATNGGLIRLDDANTLRGLHVYGTEQGLPDNFIQALQPDTLGHIWISTYTGLSCYSIAQKTFYNFRPQDTHMEGGFSHRAVATDGEGHIYFGSNTGVCRINPAQMLAQRPVSDLLIVSCEACNPEDNPDRTYLLMPDEHRMVQTSYEYNSVRIAYSMRNYAQSEQVEYSYSLLGMDDKWYDMGHRQEVYFRGLSPGRYTFMVRARMRGQDIKNAKTTWMEIRVIPPLWRTWWAYLIYAIITACFIIWVVTSYQRRMALRTSLLMERRQNRQKQELNEERLRFFTNITHELRTPLTLILGPLEDLADDPNLSQQNHRRATMIKRSAERLKELICQLLDFRRAETQCRRLTVARGDIGKYVSDICYNYQALYNNPKVSFSYVIGDNLPHIWFDSEVVHSILGNFLSNAIKYTQQGSILTTVYADEGRVTISVSDTGCGISADELPHIFDRYYQASADSQASGTGIGLALVKALADLHDAKLQVESKPGQGSRFSCSFSATYTYPKALHKEDADAPAPMPEEVIEMTGPSDGNVNVNPTLLIVEDNADIRQYIADSLGDDYEILQAENGEEGLLSAQQHMPDIIISDIMMPRLNGIEMTRRLKEDIRTSHIPIVLLTAKNTEEDKTEGYNCGADSYLTKPFSAGLLSSRIGNLLTARRRLAEYVASHGSQMSADATEPSPGTVPDCQLSRLDQEFLDRLDQLISDNLLSQDVDLPFVTEKMAMSHSSFYRKVKALTGLTAQEYIRKFKLRHCYKLLQSGDYNVNQAAMMSGFNQMAHFRDIFKAEFGILPSEVKKS